MFGCFRCVLSSRPVTFHNFGMWEFLCLAIFFFGVVPGSCSGSVGGGGPLCESAGEGESSIGRGDGAKQNFKEQAPENQRLPASAPKRMPDEFKQTPRRSQKAAKSSKGVCSLTSLNKAEQQFHGAGPRGPEIATE